MSTTRFAFPQWWQERLAAIEAERDQLRTRAEKAEAELKQWYEAGLCVRCERLVTGKEIAKGEHNGCPGPMARFERVMFVVKSHATMQFVREDAERDQLRERAEKAEAERANALAACERKDSILVDTADIDVWRTSIIGDDFCEVCGSAMPNSGCCSAPICATVRAREEVGKR